jgi:hypothetical protein
MWRPVAQLAKAAPEGGPYDPATPSRVGSRPETTETGREPLL